MPSISAFSQDPGFYTIQPPSDWVKHEEIKYDFSVPEAEVSGGVYAYFSSDQIKIDPRECYSHNVLKVISAQGLQKASTVSITFHPKFQNLVIHHFNIIRDGVSFNKLDSNRIKVLQREQGLEQNMLDGRHSFVLIIDDMRVGDILDYAFTLRGQNPSLDKLFFHSFLTESYAPIGISRCRILAPKGYDLKIAYHGKTLEPIVTENSYKEYVWDFHVNQTSRIDSNIPSWHIPFPWVEISSPSSWKDIVNWALPMYLADESLSPAVKEKIAQISADHSDEKGRFLAALHFVQNEIRYFAIEIGVNSYNPSPSSLVMERRFGDCKDKTKLLCTLLNGLNIQATPVLVNTNFRGKIADRLPSPSQFDHVIVKAKVDGQDRWVDPTYYKQGGVFDSTYIADYRIGLPISGGVQNLEEIKCPEGAFAKKEVSSVYTVEGFEGHATLNIRTVLKGALADSTRNYLQNNSSQDIDRNCTEWVGKLYPKIKLLQSVTYKDDLEKNEIVVNEEYQLEEFWKPKEGTKAIIANIVAPSIASVLLLPTSDQRTSPLSLYYPYSLQENIEVRMPKQWSISPSKFSLEDKAFQFTHESQCNANVIHLAYTYQTFKDHVPVEEISSYIPKIRRAIDSSQYQLFYNPEAEKGLSNITSLLMLITFVSLCLTLAIFAWRHRRRPHRGHNKRSHLDGLGGWLILVAIGLFSYLISYVVICFKNTPSFLNPVLISNITNPQLPNYNPILYPTIVFEVLGGIFLLVLNILVIVLFFEKSKKLPLFIIAFYVLSFSYVVLDFLLCSNIPTLPAPTPSSYGNLIGGLIRCGIWIAYFRCSQRVKDTFWR